MRLVQLFAAVSLLTATTLASAQGYPNRQVTIAVPFAAGGSTDIVARLLGEKLQTRTGQPFVVVNRPGGTGAVANTYVRSQPADGYTLYVVSSPFSTAPATNPSVHNYDPAKDFTPVAQISNILPVFIGSLKAPGQTLAEVIAYAKANPGKVTAATTGIGSSDHLAAAKLARMAGVQFNFVPYKGAALALQDMMSSVVDVRMDAYATAKPAIESGRVRALGMGTLQRSSLAPEIPTVAETVPGYNLPSYMGLMGPPGLPRAVLDRLQSELAVILKMPDVVEKMKILGLEPALSSPQEFGAYLTDHVRQQAALIKDLGIKIE